MSALCCADKETDLAPLRHKQARVLKTVLAINAAMFLIRVRGWLLHLVNGTPGRLPRHAG